MKVVSLIIIIVCCSVVYGKNGATIEDKCMKCLNDTKPIADIIKEVAIGVGPAATCEVLCKEIKKLANNSKVVDDVCLVLCGVIGIEEFYKYVNNTELNYGLFCEKTKQCPSGNGEGSVISASVNSPIILGQDINIEAIIKVDKECGLADFIFECPKNKTKLDSHYWSPLDVGGWKAEWSIATGNNWKVGKYICDLQVCDTICDSFPKEKALGMKSLTFEIKKAEIQV